MDRAEFLHDMGAHGFREISAGVAAGTEQGYPMSVIWVNKKTFNMLIRVSQEDWKAHSKDLKAALKGLAKPSWNGNALLITVNCKPMDDVFAQGVQAVVRVLKEQRMEVRDVCAVCGQAHCDIAVNRGTGYAPAHRSCVEGQINSTREKAEKNAKSGSYITGFLGAVVGMVVGLIPSALTIILMERVYALLFPLIPLAAYQGYKLARGKMNKMALVVSIVLSIAGVYVLEFGLLGYYLIRDLGLTFREMLTVMPAALGDGAMWAEITTGAITEFIFVALGIFFAWSQISRTSKTEIASAEGVLTTAIPYGAGQEPEVGDGSNYFDSTAY